MMFASFHRHANTHVCTCIQKICRFRPEKETRFNTFELQNSKQKLSTGAHMHAKLRRVGEGAIFVHNIVPLSRYM